MKFLGNVGTLFLLAGFPTAMLFYVCSDRTCWSNKKAAVISALFLVSGVVTAPLFGLGFAWFTFEDWADDRATKRVRGA